MPFINPRGQKHNRIVSKSRENKYPPGDKNKEFEYCSFFNHVKIFNS